MSAKKSWEARPKPAAGGSTRAHGGKHSLKDRRRKAKRAFFTLLAIVAGLSLLGALYAVWQQPMRIQEVTVDGPYAQSVHAIAEASLRGSYLYLVPRDSILFYPERHMREAILDAHPEIAAVSVVRTSFSSIAVRSIERMPAFMWCGPSVETAIADGTCYNVDAEGMIFAAVPPGSAASSTILRIYAPLAGEAEAVEDPRRFFVEGAYSIPGALRFVKAMQGLSVPVRSIALRGDEADLYVAGGTRITYVLGKEEEAAALAAASFPTLTLTNGTIDYVDLRFNKKVYLKKYGE